MNIAEKLLKADVKKAEELETGVFESARLAKILGETEKVPVKIREIKSRRLNDLAMYQVDRKGKIDFSKTYDAKINVCMEGVVEPDLRDKELQAHFNCKSGRELCEKLFESEVATLSDAISELSGITDEEDVEEEVKN